MKRFFRKAGVFTVYFMLTTIMLSRTAHAYIDPAATSYIVQIVAGIVIACGVAVGVFWKKIRVFFRNQKLQHLEKSIAKKAKRQSQ